MLIHIFKQFRNFKSSLQLKQNKINSINFNKNNCMNLSKMYYSDEIPISKCNITNPSARNLKKNSEENKKENFAEILFEVLESFKKENSNDELDGLIADKYKNLSKDELISNPNTKEEIFEILNNLINEKLRVELINIYSNKGSVTDQNLLLKKIFEDIDKKIKEKPAEKKLDFNYESLSIIFYFNLSLAEYEKRIYNMTNNSSKIKKQKALYQLEEKDEVNENTDDHLKIIMKSIYGNYYKEFNNANKPKTEILDKMNFIPFMESRKLNMNIDAFYDKKELKFDNHEFVRIELDQKAQVPELSMNLINVVQNPGIYTLQSVKRMNKDISIRLLENLPTPEMISFESLDTYMRPYEDPNLKMMMKKYNYKYSSSTSGIGETLAHFFYKLTNFKSPHFYNLSEHYVNEPLKFMMFQRKPASITLHKIDKKHYTISKNNVFESKEEFILMKMGKYMEKIFTHHPDEFEKKYMKRSGSKDKEIVIKEDDHFKFVGYDKILLRSQIDCGGKDANGNDIVFEIKTRAVAPIRYDVHNYMDYLDYEVSSLYGRHSSYEREFYDLIRGAFLKYLFQLKIGGMKGALISFHNTQKIFGFEYVSLQDMERRVLGNSNFSDIIFKASLKLLEEVLDTITKDFPDEDKIFIGFYANEWKGTLDVFVEIVKEDTYTDFQKVNPREIIDYYYLTGYRPTVHKYTVVATPILNNVITTFSPILFENNDTFHVKYKIAYSGQPEFGEYMQFIHEACMQKESINLLNEYTGSWTGAYEN